MEYTVKGLAALAGVTIRTLRHYDQIGLLNPGRINSSGYRIYGPSEVDRLQQILIYRELGLPLEEIRKILASKEFDEARALEHHLQELRARKALLEGLIVTVERTLSSKKGGELMKDQDKFEGLKKKLIEDNEKTYGQELIEKYGKERIKESNGKLMGLSTEAYEKLQGLTLKLNETLKEAVEAGDPAGVKAQETCALHREWITFFWPTYSAEAHMGLVQNYVDDPRFGQYYDQVAPGSAVFLRDAMKNFLAKSLS